METTKLIDTLNTIDETLRYLEDFSHGEEGQKITHCRKLIEQSITEITKDKENLVAIIRKHFNGYAPDRIADTLAENLANDILGTTKWISVEETDKLPYNKGEVLFLVGGTDVYVGILHHGQFQCYGQGVKPITDMKVTHWMPLPSTPQ